MYCQKCDVISALTIEQQQLVDWLKQLNTVEHSLALSPVEATRKLRTQKQLASRKQMYESQLDQVSRELQFLRVYHAHADTRTLIKNYVF